MGGKIKNIVVILALPVLASCASKPPMATAQVLDNTLNTASGSPMAISTPAAIIANPEATQIALQCENQANSAKQSGKNDATSQDVYYGCLKSAFNVAD